MILYLCESVRLSLVRACSAETRTKREAYRRREGARTCLSQRENGAVALAVQVAPPLASHLGFRVSIGVRA